MLADLFSDLPPVGFAEKLLALETNVACGVSGRFLRSIP
jgi:hypothetical protein